MVLTALIYAWNVSRYKCTQVVCYKWGLLGERERHNIKIPVSSQRHRRQSFGYIQYMKSQIFWFIPSSNIKSNNGGAILAVIRMLAGLVHFVNYNHKSIRPGKANLLWLLKFSDFFTLQMCLTSSFYHRKPFISYAFIQHESGMISG